MSAPELRVGLLTAAYLLRAPCPAPEELREHRLELAALVPACARRGIALEPLAWDAPALDPRSHDAFVIRSTWDYAARPEAFLARLAELEARRPLLNPLATVRWNLPKTHLRELAAAGVATVPTLWRERADAETLAAAFDALDDERLVVKPVVGQNAWRQALVERGAPLPPPEEFPPADAMIQPFLPSIATAGERSLVFLGGELSHAVRKLPAAGDYRIQSSWGGSEAVHAPTAEEEVAARAALAALPRPPFQARVDLVSGPAGEPLLMELELIEPYLYPEQGPELGERFAAALARELGR
jgi:glutathione synthase/RimK-type ligase-like ATP-grasp enzyme